MSFQYTYDAEGKPIGVFVPINEWNQITSELKKKFPPQKTSKANMNILASIEKGLKQVRKIETGKLKSISLKQLLDEL